MQVHHLNVSSAVADFEYRLVEKSLDRLDEIANGVHALRTCVLALANEYKSIQAMYVRSNFFHWDEGFDWNIGYQTSFTRWTNSALRF